MTQSVDTEKNLPVSSGEDDMSQFLREIRQYPRLTPEEEKALARRCAAGDEDAIRQMVNSNLRLVVSIAREYAGRGVALLDLIQEGSIGLLTAARKFDYTMDCRFSTYATKWIRQGVTRCLINHGSPIRVPLHTAEKMRAVAAAKNALTQETGQEPTTAQVARRCGLPEQRVKELMLLTPDVCSLDVPTGEGDDGVLGNLVEDSLSPSALSGACAPGIGKRHCPAPFHFESPAAAGAAASLRHGGRGLSFLGGNRQAAGHFQGAGSPD